MFKNLSQQSLPHLWLIFQHLFAPTSAKRQIALSYMGDSHTVLEVGCSLGIVADAFKRVEGIQYLGIDIDEQAIRMAKKKYSSYLQMDFSSKNIEQLVKDGKQFDYVIFANILHHVDDKKAQELLRTAAVLVRTNGTLLIMEPDTLRKGDSIIARLIHRLEKGLYRRPYDHLIALAKETGLTMNSDTTEFYSIGLLPGVRCGHLQVISLKNE